MSSTRTKMRVRVTDGQVRSALHLQRKEREGYPESGRPLVTGDRAQWHMYVCVLRKAA